MRLASLALLIAVAAAGCGSRGASAPPAPGNPGPAAQPERRGYRVAVVDIERVGRMHPLWKDLQAVMARQARLEQDLLTGPILPPPDLPEKREIEATYRGEAARVQQQFQEEMRLLQDQGKAEIERYAAKVQKDGQARIEQARAEIDARFRDQLRARQAELRDQQRDYELTLSEEYRLRLLNLRLKIDTLAHTNKDEADKLIAEYERLQQERDAKVEARRQELDAAFKQYAEQIEKTANAELKAAKDRVTKESTALVKAKEAEVRARLEAQAKAKRQALEEALKARQGELVAGANQQIRSQQGEFLRQIQEYQQKIRAEIDAVRAERMRLELAITADIKIEVAAIAVAEGYDVVLIRAISARNVTDITDRVIAKIRK